MFIKYRLHKITVDTERILKSHECTVLKYAVIYTYYLYSVSKTFAIMFFLYLKLSCQALIKIDIAKHLFNVFIFEYKWNNNQNIKNKS